MSSRSCGLWLINISMMTALAIPMALISATAWGQVQTPGTGSAHDFSEAERTKKLQDRDQLRMLTSLLARKGEFEKSSKLMVKEIALTRDLMGELHDDVINSLLNLARLQEVREDWAAAHASRAEVVDIRERQPDQKDWRIGDSRRALTDLDRRATLSPAQRGRLQKADLLDRIQSENQKKGKHAEGVAPCREAMEIRREILGEDHPGYGLTLNNLATLYQGMGDYATAEPLFRDCLEILKRALGEDHPSYAHSLGNMAFMYHAMGDDAKAESFFRESLEISERVLGEGHPDRASSLNNLSIVYKMRGEYWKAEPLLRQALEITKGSLGEDHLGYALSLNNMGLLYKLMGEYAKAEPLLRQALEITKRSLGEVHPQSVERQSTLGSLYAVMGDYAKAEPLLCQALEVTKSALGEYHSAHAARLYDLAVLYLTVGDHAKAEPPLRQALEINQRALGENHLKCAMILNALGSLYKEMGDHAKAESLLRQSMEIAKRATGEDFLIHAGVLNNLAQLYKEMGDFQEAEAMIREVLDIQKRAKAEHHPDYAGGLNNLATLYQTTGEYTRAEPLLRQALEIAKRSLGEDHPKYATCLNNLGSLYHSMGDYAKAELLVRQALETTKRALGEDHPNYANSLGHLGSLYSSMGDYAKAEPPLRQALEIKKRVQGVAHPGYADSLKDLATLSYRRGDLDEGEQDAGKGLEIYTEWTRDKLATLGERRRISLLAMQGGYLMLYLSIANTNESSVDEIYRHVLAWKGIVEARQNEDRLARDQPGLRGRLDQLAQARADLARLAFATPPPDQAQAWRQQLDALRDRKENLEAELARESGAFRRVQANRRLGAAEVAAALPPGAALVDVLDYVHSSPPKAGEGPFRNERRFVAFVLRRGQAPVLVHLGVSAPVSKAVQDWREAQVAGETGSMEAAALELSRRVWEPIKPHLEGASTVLIAPDGALAAFPMAALPGQRPGTYLLEDMAIGYVGSAHRLVETLAAPVEEKGNEPEAAGLLAIGGIDYQADPGGTLPNGSSPNPGVLVVDSDRAGFKALAGTGPEARQVGKLFDATFPQQHALVLTGAEPTEAAIKRQLGRHWRYLHLATHGFFESPSKVSALRAGLSSDGFGPGLPSPLDSEASASLALTPLLHSGVALAGAASKPEVAGSGPRSSLPDRDDGILTAEEVQSLDLRGTELVVLSACETGLGKNYNGQGVLGLQRAVQSAGARVVVASLWKVDDVATTLLMEHFYANLWSRNLPKLEALRQAQLTILNNPGMVKSRRAELAGERGIDEKSEKLPKGKATTAADASSLRSNPSLWAAFILSGDLR